MKETLWVVAMVGVMMLVGIARAVPFFDLLEVGQAVMLYGAAIGVPLEIAYFTLLWLSLRGTLPKGWYWRPFVHHHLLARRQRWWVLPFFYSGWASFGIATLGIVIVVLAIITVSFDS